MPNIRTRIQQTKQFVQKHPTITACVITAVVTNKITRKATIKAVLDETTALSYTWGREAGVLSIALEEAYNFIREHGLENEFAESWAKVAA